MAVFVQSLVEKLIRAAAAHPTATVGFGCFVLGMLVERATHRRK